MNELLRHHASSVRLRAALDIGTAPDLQFLDALMQRCAVEPDFQVREVLTWALIRLPASATVPRLIEEVRTGGAQARSQALHTLSKIQNPSVWEAITSSVLVDPDDEVARSAWRAAVVLVPAGSESALATMLATQLGRGGHDVQRSLSRALVALGSVIEPMLREAASSRDPAVRAHAQATEALLRDPDAGFAVFEAKRVDALGVVDSAG
ncbi:HEAT repeat domain-containing protein [Rhodococcus sp. IEGM 1401]|uniref:HEAT repeat domain-containing protein n=1 Tax=unclassified Rhodococcus (in: high G+C Gram-positive bacteria) TaxID=192944 RepID=UPI0022B40712|nr:MULTISPECIES: HEAT repeat domain-containing protein [unclassified Rhodococcus (in: high G+C Gram-positive bacteria)]MCZ4563898.1 HEAT repeat domain-containing protein [Rhodococcus sp. IEGM 1401]MDI9924003.1 HEAT repeat domain-containing protein [Rhodococcus sp. IEGM 1372]MDV8036487.1 HEAT repeat domain-containing protein [Rhodococcus sp. IEGM 1414]